MTKKEFEDDFKVQSALGTASFSMVTAVLKTEPWIDRAFMAEMLR